VSGSRPGPLVRGENRHASPGAGTATGNGTYPSGRSRGGALCLRCPQASTKAMVVEFVAGLTTACGHGLAVATTVDGVGSGRGGGSCCSVRDCPNASSTARSTAKTRETVVTTFFQCAANGQ